MIYVASALIALLALTVTGFAGVLRGQQRAYARREDLILNQLLHAVGKPWLPAPADEPSPSAEPAEPAPLRFVDNPSHFPIQ